MAARSAMASMRSFERRQKEARAFGDALRYVGLQT
jgi:hypothetical protein